MKIINAYRKRYHPLPFHIKVVIIGAIFFALGCLHAYLNNYIIEM